MPLIELINAARFYGEGEGRVTALEDISITVNRGEFVAVAGASGSGKSTLMNMLGCLDTPSRGEYRLHGVSVGELSERELTNIRSREIGYRAGQCGTAAYIQRRIKGSQKRACLKGIGKSISEKPCRSLAEPYVGGTAAACRYSPRDRLRAAHNTCGRAHGKP